MTGFLIDITAQWQYGDTLVRKQSDENEVDFPKVFTECGVTCSMTHASVDSVPSPEKLKCAELCVYHAQRQGTLERFHQTLKSLLRTYCVQMERDWEEGLPQLLLAAREVTQETTGFSPNELVFGNTMRGMVIV